MKRTTNSALSGLVGKLLRDARKDLKITREELARRAHVSSRLVAELERGQRPNVSLESALKLLSATGTTILLRSPAGQTAEVGDDRSALTQRAARSEVRRKTWSGGHIPLHRELGAPAGGTSSVERLEAVSAVSRQAFQIAGSRKATRER